MCINLNQCMHDRLMWAHESTAPSNLHYQTYTMKKDTIKIRKLPYAVNCAEYEEQIFGTIKTPKKPESSRVSSAQPFVSVINQSNESVKKYPFTSVNSYPF